MVNGKIHIYSLNLKVKLVMKDDSLTDDDADMVEDMEEADI